MGFQRSVRAFIVSVPTVTNAQAWAPPEGIHRTTAIRHQEHGGIVLCHLDGTPYQALMGHHRDILAQAITAAFVHGHHFRPRTGINTDHFGHHRLRKGQRAKAQQLAQALLLQVGFLVVRELSSQHVHLALQAQILLTDLHEVDIALPEAAETLRHTRNHLLQRHHHREGCTFQQRRLRRHTRFERGQRQCQQNQTEEEGDGFPALCQSFHRFCAHRHTHPCMGHAWSDLPTA